MIGMSEKRGGRARRAANPRDGVFARREAGEASGARARRPPRSVPWSSACVPGTTTRNLEEMQRGAGPGRKRPGFRERELRFWPGH